LRYDTRVREHLEDRFFWIALWAFIASAAFVIARSPAASSYVGNVLPINTALFAIIGFIVCVVRAVSDAVWKNDGRASAYTTNGRRVAICRPTRGHLAALFVLAPFVGLGTAVLILLVASMFTRED
jgi:hypothetical protein